MHRSDLSFISHTYSIKGILFTSGSIQYLQSSNQSQPLLLATTLLQATKPNYTSSRIKTYTHLHSLPLRVGEREPRFMTLLVKTLHLLHSGVRKERRMDTKNKTAVIVLTIALYLKMLIMRVLYRQSRMCYTGA